MGRAVTLTALYVDSTEPFGTMMSAQFAMINNIGQI